MTGYEKSPDYGGPEPTWRGAAISFIFIVIVMILVAWVFS
jgi:hypothetical protein